MNVQFYIIIHKDFLNKEAIEIFSYLILFYVSSKIKFRVPEKVFKLLKMHCIIKISFYTMISKLPVILQENCKYLFFEKLGNIMVGIIDVIIV